MFRLCYFVFASFVLAFSSHAAGTANLSEAQKDEDFAIQGEYVGLNQAMQVIARGDGEFDLVIFEGGLPGAGAKANPRRIESDIEVVSELIESMKLTRVERKSPTLGRQAPPGAEVLFDGTQASVDQKWVSGQLCEEGWLTQGTQTKQTFGDYQLHLEFRTPWAPEREGQGRGNSGVYHQARYETQVLDSFGLEGLNNETGGIYEISAPSVNACFPPMSWQTYDVDFTAARFDTEGKKTSNARITVRLNGIMVQNDVELPKATRASKLKEGPEPGPIYLQNHGDPVRFRNLWVMPRDSEREARRPLVPGFERFAGTQSTSTADGGWVLMNSLACTACHAEESVNLPSVPEQRGPDLSEVAGRVRHDALVAMIADPHSSKPNTTMPDPWPGSDTATRRAHAAKIASYLVLEGKGRIVDRPVSQVVVDRGKELYHTVGCVACHASLEGPATPKATSVPLGEVHKKYTVPSLAAFLRNCNQVRPGIRMPALVGDAGEARAIAAYLTRSVTQSEVATQLTRKLYKGSWKKLPDFDALEPIETVEAKSLSIQGLQLKNQFGVVFEGNLAIESDGEYKFLLRSDDGSRLRVGKHELIHDGIHPASTRNAKFLLKAGLYPIRIEYFDGGGQIELKLEVADPQMGRVDLMSLISGVDETAEPLDMLPSEFVADASLVNDGRELFASSGCVQCHAFPDVSRGSFPSPLRAPALHELRSGKGCLASDVKSPAMDYHLGSSQVMGLEAALASLDAAAIVRTADSEVHLAMVALNCYACHVRQTIGGPEPSRDSYFQTAIPEMGWEGRLPPSLDGVADKLNDEYLTGVLENGANARDYMATRMPAFHNEKLQPLVNALIALDRRDEMESTVSTLSPDEIIINGRKLCGDEGLSCIKCHSFGGDKGGGLGAIDMLAMPKRLRESWFQRYLQDPTKYRPGTRMPNSFVDGRSAIVDINDGSPPLQIDAMWKFLSMGEEAKEPLGLNQAAIVLKAVERPRIYRNFFTDISARGIGIAYPSGLNLLWDAEQMSLSRVWKNEFVDASMHWVGRGQGRQKSQGDAIVAIDSSVPVAKLDSLSNPWPTETARELGYRFAGYALDAKGNPAFRYRIGDTEIEDKPVAFKSGFYREITIHAKEDLVIQLGSGKVEAIKGGFRVNGNHTVKVDGLDFAIVEIDGKSSLRGRIVGGSTSTVTQSIRW